MNPETVTDGKLISKDDYYKDVECISFSGLKVFSKCETLYRDLFVTKVYEEPDHDYFTYGKLVDAMVTEPDDFIEKNFMRVERRINVEDALKIENSIVMLETEVFEKEAEIAVKPNKTTEKGIVSRKAKIEEYKGQLEIIKGLADKIQVTGALWENAESTALALKTHPSFVQMEFNDVTSQQIFTTVIDGIPCKGKLDHLKLSPALIKLYAIYIANQMTLSQLQFKIANDVHPNDLWAIITDIKTCRDIALLEPNNTHYRGQLGFYQTLVSAVLKIPIANIRVRILVADKLSNTFKKCELFEYSQETIDDLKVDVWAWAKLWQTASQSRTWRSAKEKEGWHQKCFTCTECRFCPFSVRPGDPVMVNGPRLDKSNLAPLVEDLSTADAVLDY